MKHFNRSKITNKDLNYALQDKNSLSLMIGLKEPYQNHYKKKAKNWKLVNKKLVIRNEIKNIELSAFKPLYPLNLELDWMSIGGKIPNTVDNSTLVNKNTSNKSKKNNGIKIRMIDGGKGQKFAVKEIVPNLLSVVRNPNFNYYTRKRRSSSALSLGS